MDKKPGFFQDDKGNFSSKRLTSFVCLMVASILALFQLFAGAFMNPPVTIPYLMPMIVSFLSACLALQGITWGQEIFSIKKGLIPVNKEGEKK